MATKTETTIERKTCQNDGKTCVAELRLTEWSNTGAKNWSIWMPAAADGKMIDVYNGDDEATVREQWSGIDSQCTVIDHEIL